MEASQYYIDYDPKIYRHLSVYKETAIGEKLSEQIPTFECIVEDWISPYWIQFIKDNCRNKYPFLFVTKTAIREFKDGHPTLPLIIEEDDMVALLNSHDLVSSSIMWVTPAGLLTTTSHGKSVNIQLKANNFSTGTLQYDLIDGILPLNLILSSNGLISGYISDSAITGDIEFTIRCSGASNTVSRRFFIRIENNPPVWQTPSGPLVTWGVGVIFDFSIVAVDPEGNNVTYSLDTGALPPGLVLNKSTGRIFGYPEVPGEYSFIAEASDGKLTAKRSFTITIV